MEVESYRELKVLEEISANPQLTQRHLASRLEVALGLTNLMIRRLITKGYVEAVNTRKNRLQYLVTPRGLAEKTRLTYEFMEYSLHLYRRVREVLKVHLVRLLPGGKGNVVFFGTGEIAEIAYLTLRELGLNLVAVIDDQAAGNTFLGVPVLRMEAAPHLAFDCGIISSLTNGLEATQRRLKELGVPPEKLLVIERDRARIEAFVPGVDR